ncbi:MFS general substrate transporter [Lophiostoma macrostomum CBS 122681]|uniref:MFS general substrate transporter n=1 Tax=Lophiostoma macrostomum CBS 122681 TaxID=1314788 RepID=A0A6A6TJ16_9PLEO|nr:MFS general substrate transporter [Lophiostoma macrostomum CBS 122681]
MSDGNRESSSTDIPFAVKKGPSDGIRPVQTNDTTALVDGKRVLREEDVFHKTAYAWSTKKKWAILSVVALCQTSMNFNAAVYSNAIGGLNEHYGVTNARMGMVAFLVTYAFGCELWAPWSEEIGRFPIMQASLFFVNVSQLFSALSVNMGMVFFGRAFGGLSSAGGSVTLGMVADMFDADDQQFAVLWASLWSCLGAVIGGICGGPIEAFLPWRWNFWIQLIFGVVVQAIHFFGAEETRSTVMLDKEAKQLRKSGEDTNIYGPNEVKTLKERFPPKEIFETMWRPYRMLLTEPIVLFLSLLSGFADALIFSFLESYGIVFKAWGFNEWHFGLAMIPLLIGYFASYFSFFPIVRRHNRLRKAGKLLSPETRLKLLCWETWLLPIGLLGSAFVVVGPPLPWIAPLIFSVLIGMANYAIYFATIDYMVAAYGKSSYAASATGGNGFARDFLAGMCALYTGPMYKNLGAQKSTFLLFGISVAVCIPVIAFYVYGERIRKSSKFAQELQAKKETRATDKDNLVSQAKEQRVVDAGQAV